MLSTNQSRLEYLLGLLRELEQRPVLAHEQSIAEVARTSLIDAIRELSHQLHDHDYQRSCPPCSEPHRGSVA